MRVVLDTTILVSAFLSTRGNPARVMRAWEDERFDVVVSEELLEEYGRALSYPRVAAKHGMGQQQVSDAIQGLRAIAMIVALDEIPRVVPDDPDDDVIIATAVVGRASYIVTGDNHLLRIQRHDDVEILTPASYLLVLDSEPAKRASRPPGSMLE